MDGYHATLSLVLAAADDDAICLTQAVAGAGNLTIAGALATGGVATMDNSQKIRIHSAGNDSGRIFTLYGTARNGKVLSESLTGANIGDVDSTHQYATVTRVAIDGAAAGNVKVGTTALGSTAPYIVDRFVANGNLSYSLLNSSGALMQPALEVAFEELAPYWETEQTLPNWIKYDDGTMGIIKGPITMVRLTNFGGSGTAAARIITPFKAGRV